MAKRKFRNGGVVQAHANYMLGLIWTVVVQLTNVWLRRRRMMGEARSRTRCGLDVHRVGDLISDAVEITNLRREVARLLSFGRQAQSRWRFNHPSEVLNGQHLARALRGGYRHPLDDANSAVSSEDSDGERQAIARRRARVANGNINAASDEDYNSDTTEEYDPDVLIFDRDPDNDRGPDGGAPPAVSA